MAGDLITAIDDSRSEGLTLEAAFGRISGRLRHVSSKSRQGQNDPLVVAFAREAVPLHVSSFKPVSRTDSSSKQRAADRSLISTGVSRRPWRGSLMDDSKSVASHTDAFTRDAAGEVNGAVLIRDHGTTRRSLMGHTAADEMEEACAARTLGCRRSLNVGRFRPPLNFETKAPRARSDRLQSRSADIRSKTTVRINCRVGSAFLSADLDLMPSFAESRLLHCLLDQVPRS
jgi:hypothetical protein